MHFGSITSRANQPPQTHFSRKVTFPKKTGLPAAAAGAATNALLAGSASGAPAPPAAPNSASLSFLARLNVTKS